MPIGASHLFLQAIFLVSANAHQGLDPSGSTSLRPLGLHKGLLFAPVAPVTVHLDMAGLTVRHLHDGTILQELLLGFIPIMFVKHSFQLTGFSFCLGSPGARPSPPHLSVHSLTLLGPGLLSPIGLGLGADFKALKKLAAQLLLLSSASTS